MDIIQLGKKYNNTTIFLLPVVAENKKFTDIISNKFINSYIIPGTGNKRIAILEENNIIKECLQIEDRFLNNLNLFFEGKYSFFSRNVKEIILKFWNLDENSILFQVLYNSKTMKLEYWSKIAGTTVLDFKAENWPKPNPHFEFINFDVKWKK